jgi:hypothetical protein
MSDDDKAREEFDRLCGKTENPQLFTDVEFVDAQQMARDHPDSFEAPSPEELAALVVGDVVKVCDTQERFWTVIKEFKEDDVIVAEVNNSLISGQEFNLGDLIEFKKCHIYAIHKEEDIDKRGQMLAFFASLTGGDIGMAIDMMEKFMRSQNED